MQKIYTKTGDKGKTSLFNGQRVLKSDPRVITYGTVDELSSLLGVVLSFAKDKKIHKILLSLQDDLPYINAWLANPDAEKVAFLSSRVVQFEKTIDELTTTLPPLANFILPGGGKSGALLHLARSVTRRVERELVAFAQTEELDPQILKYFNRLSDLLFTLSRFVNYKEKQKEVIWKKENK